MIKGVWENQQKWNFFCLLLGCIYPDAGADKISIYLINVGR